jgi:site-specific DNA-methyltransferase (adenine-specific)
VGGPPSKGAIYAYRFKAGAVPEKEGFVKVGKTTLRKGESLEKAAERRIAEQTTTAGMRNSVERVGVWSVPPNWGAKEFENVVHNKLEFERGAVRLKGKGDGREWFLCKDSDVEDAVAAAATGDSLRLLNDYGMRKEQEDFVTATAQFFDEAIGEAPPRYLWNAKMRFGKTHAAYQLARRQGWTRILVLTHFPAVVGEWRDNLLGHSAFKGWNFFTRVGTGLSAEEALRQGEELLENPSPLVFFASFQDVASPTSAGKAHVDLLCTTEWDCVIIDEYHLGGQSALNESFMNTEAVVVDDPELAAQEEVVSQLKGARRFLMLSGTPFRALASRVFNGAVSTWSYQDEQKAKQDWDPKNGANQYESLPSLSIITFELSDEITTLASGGLRDEFSLNQLFSTKNKKFVLAGAVNHWLDLLAGADAQRQMEALDDGYTDDISPFRHPDLRDATRHSIWLFKTVDACRAMGEALENHPYFRNYVVRVFAGNEEAKNAAETAKEAKNFLRVNEIRGKRSIILSCGKLTAGVTLPELGSVFMLTDTTSPELYFQVAFRAQSPYVDPSTGKVLKSKCYVFDFTQNRTLEVLVDYAVALRPEPPKNAPRTAVDHQNALAELTKFLPVYSFGLKGMAPMNTSDIMAALVAHETPASVRDGIKSKRGITNRLDVINAIAQDEELLEWLQKVEIRRNATKKKTPDLEKAAEVVIKNNAIINPPGVKQRTKVEDSDEVKKAKKEARDNANIIRDALTGISEQITSFMYLSDHPEMRLWEALSAEPDIFHKAVGIPQSIAFRLYEMGAFNEAYMDKLVHRFMLLEDESLELLHPHVAEARRSAFRYQPPKRKEGQGPTDTVLEALEGNRDGQIHTPRSIAQDMLDKLPPEIWSNPNIRILDPACKSGVFLLEAAKRLNEGLEHIPGFEDRDARIHHILTKQLFGVATTYKSALVARRTLYGSKIANHPELSCGYFTNPNGNITHPELEHAFTKKEACDICGMPKEDFAISDEDRESHAYPFIHTGNPKTLFHDDQGETMKFDVIIGNPPYQVNDGGGGKGSSAVPLYHKFVNTAKALHPKYLSFVIPARWFAGGKGLDKFREEMIADRRISKIVDYPNASECFPGVEIKGGVMYFLWDRDHDGDCEWVNVRSGQFSEPALRDLRDAGDTIVREEIAFGILDKVQTIHTGNWMDSEVSARKPFGFDSTKRGKPTKSSVDIKLYQNGGIGYVTRKEILKNSGWVDKWKAIFPKAGGDGMKTLPNVVTGKPFVAEKGSACTETYLVAGLFDSKAAAERRVAYMKTRFFRFMVSLRKISQNSSQGTYAFVPVMDPKQDWTDEKLYKHFKLTKEEIAHIEATVKEMQ